jgi:hypothetical protein
MPALPPTPAAAPAPAAAPEFKLTMFLPMIVLMGWSKLGIDTSPGTDALLYIRIAFYTVAISCALCGLYIQSLAKASNNLEKITVVTPASMGTEAKTEEMTVSEYDAKKATELITTTFMPICIISLMHWKWEFVRPLVMQCVMMPNSLLDNQLFKIYILGHKAEGKLKRPWVKPPGLMSQLTGGGAAAPAPAVPATKETTKGKKKNGKKSSRPSGNTGETEQSASRAKDTKKTK